MHFQPNNVYKGLSTLGTILVSLKNVPLENKRYLSFLGFIKSLKSCYNVEVVTTNMKWISGSTEASLLETRTPNDTEKSTIPK